MGLPLPNLVQNGFLPHLELMDFLLYWLAFSSVKINEEFGEDFKLARSVRQGCSLAPYLFILATDVLGHLLNDPEHKIEGLHLPKGGCV